MSGLVAVWHRDGAPLDRAAFDRVVSSLAHRAIDGQGEWIAPGGSVALAHNHFWTTPEEVGEAQPLVSGDVGLVFDGRVDNRGELAAALDLSATEAAVLSDAALVLKAYERWNDACMTRLLGPFALVIWDGRARRIVCARDPLGRRSLFYSLDNNRLVVASEPGAVLGGDPSGETLDEVFLAHFFAIRRAPGGRTMFESVRELQPGHALTVTPDSAHLEPYWSLQLAPIRYGSMADYGERFRELLDLAVARRMRAPKVPGVMMSGGLDSTSVAALAARRLAADAPDQRLKVYSYVFDDLTDLDEREWMRPMVEMYGLDQTQVVADDAWPLSDFDRWVWNPSGPMTGGFDPLNELMFAAARADGRRVLLTGGGSDSLFIDGQESWLADLVADHCYREAAGETARHIRRLGIGPVLRSRSVRRLGARLIGHKSRRRPVPPPWLTPPTAARIVAPEEPDMITGTRRPQQDIRALWDALNSSDGINSGFRSHRSRIDVRDPFTDLDLVAFTMAVPAYALYNRGTTKYLLRQAMGVRLPPAIHDRRRRSDISPLYWRGLDQSRSQLTTGLVAGTNARWRAYVRGEAVEGIRVTPPPTGALALVGWYCLTYEWWRCHLDGRLALNGS